MNSLDDNVIDRILAKACSNDDIATSNAVSCVSERFKDAIDRLHPISKVSLDMATLDPDDVIGWAMTHGATVRELRYREVDTPDLVGYFNHSPRFDINNHNRRHTFGNDDTGSQCRILDWQIVEEFTGLRSLVFVHNSIASWKSAENTLSDLNLTLLESSRETLEHLDVYIEVIMDECADTGCIDGDLPRLKQLFLGSENEEFYYLDDLFFTKCPNLEVFRCYGKARVDPAAKFYEHLAEHQNLREIRLNTRRYFYYGEAAMGVYIPVRLPKQIEYADLQYAEIDDRSFEGCKQLRVLMLPPPHYSDVCNYDGFDTSNWDHWRHSMEVMVVDMECLEWVLPSETVRAPGPPKLALYLELAGYCSKEVMEDHAGEVVIPSTMANISELVCSVTVCKRRGYPIAKMTVAEVFDTVRAMCPHAVIDIVECRSARDYYVECVEDVSTTLGQPAAKWWTRDDTYDASPPSSPRRWDDELRRQAAKLININ